MSRTLRTVALIAGTVALAATGVGAVVGATAAAAAGSAGIGALSLTTLASTAAVVGTAASIGAQLTAKKPAAVGSVTDVTIQVDAPQPYMMGRTYSAGVLRHEVGYGGEVNDVKNPYLAKVIVYSGGGPIQEVESRQLDYQPLDLVSGGWYNGFVGTPGQLGECPQPSAMVPPFAGMPDWGPDYKLNGQAAILWNFKFDKKAKRFGSGIPPHGIVAKGVRTYDPRKDSTYPGGSGNHRITNEGSWQYTENPALHALTYIYGRHQNGKKVFGIGMPIEGINIPTFVALANVCDANGWKVGGSIFEPGDRWDNLKNILQSGGAEPIFAGGQITCRYRSPRVPLETITEQDITDGDMEVVTAQSYRDRVNGIIPKYRSEDHNWQYVSDETVSVPSYVTEDGEEKVVERQLNLVQDKDQAAQLAAYELVDGREMGPITLTLKPKWRRYMPGDCLHLDLPSLQVDHDAIILTREFDPITMTVRLTFISETPGKHAFALGQTGTPPPTPSLTDPEQRDDALTDEYVANLPSVVTETGILQPDTVYTEAVQENAITSRYIDQVTSTITTIDGAPITLFTINAIKREDESDIDIDLSIRFQSNDDVRGALYIYRAGTPITSFGLFMNGAGGDFRIPISLLHTDIGVPAGTYNYVVSFTRQGGASTLEVVSGSLMRLKEYKR